MPVTVYVLVRTRPGMSAEVARRARGITGVKAAETVTGRFDVIITAEVPQLTNVGNLVISQIQSIDGVERTETAIAL